MKNPSTRTAIMAVFWKNNETTLEFFVQQGLFGHTLDGRNM
jgi:hypothetical protein